MGIITEIPHSGAFSPTPLFSQRVQQWEPGAIRSLLPLESIPGMISLVAGKPNPETFPFSKITISLKGAEKNPIVLEQSELSDALQYGLPGGYRPFIQWLEGLQRKVHGIVDNDQWACCVGNGSQELIHRAFQVFTDPGDPVLIETPAYPGVAGFLRADGHELVEVAADTDGLNADDLERVLLDWPEHRPRPKILYTIPTGSNPTGQSCSEARKRKILRLAQKFNFMIFEDDAYYFINFEPPAQRARSYLSLEHEVNGETGRVIRFDSLSKIVSSGLRLGIITGPISVIQRVTKITENINLQPSSTSQLLAFSLFRQWGHAGFLKHCTKVADFYRQKRDAFAAAADRNLTGKATWTVPTAGMFFWLTLQLPDGEDSFALLSDKGMEYRILAIPGVAFMPNPRRSCQMRVSYSLVSEVEMDEACRRIAQLVVAAGQDSAGSSLMASSL